MKNTFIFLLLFFILPTYADVFTDNIVNGCERSRLGITPNVNIIAKYEPIQITCGTGQYLPVKSTVCIDCPNEATCNGGTYAFNEIKNQGIVYNDNFQQDKPFGCNSALLGIQAAVSIRAKFIPNVINLNWYDGNETVTQTSCAYDSTITLPATQPTKTGYTFGGWKLRESQNNESE